MHGDDNMFGDLEAKVGSTIYIYSVKSIRSSESKQFSDLYLYYASKNIPKDDCNGTG